MRKCDMREMLDRMIEDAERHLCDLKLLRAEMKNRPPRMMGKSTSVTVTPEIKFRILQIRATVPDMPQHEIAKILHITPARVSEVVAGKRF